MNNELEPVAFVREDGSICTYLGVDPKPGADLYELPALTDEQVREIVRKAAVQFPVRDRIYAYDIIEAAIREAIGRGERG